MSPTRFACVVMGCASIVISPASARREDPIETAAALDSQVSTLLAAGDIQAALLAARDAMRLHREQLDETTASQAQYAEELAVLFFDAPGATSQAWDAAEQFLTEALALREREGETNPLALAQTLDLLSTLYFNEDKWDDAERLERRTVALRAQHLDAADPLVGQSRDGLGQILLKQGRYAEARVEIEAALAIFRAGQPADPVRVAESLNNFAEVLRVTDDYQQAEAAETEALTLADTPGSRDEGQVARLSNNLAGLYKDQSRYDEAEALLRRSLQLREQAAQPNPLDIATACLNLAELHRLCGELEQAGPLYARALDLARAAMAPDNAELAWYINQMAVFREEQGSLDQAEQLYREALALLTASIGPEHPMVAQTLHDLATLLLLRANYAEAERDFQQALAIRQSVSGDDHPEVAATLTGLAGALGHIPGRQQEALAACDRALAILGATPAFPETKAEAFAQRGILKRSSGDRAGAVGDLESAVGVVEGLRPHSAGGEGARARYFGRYSGYYQRLIEWLLEDGQIDKAFEYSERARSRALLDQLAAARVDLRAEIQPELRASLDAREREAASRLAEFQQRITFMRSRTDVDRAQRMQRIEDLQNRLTAAARDYRQVYEEIKNASPLWRRSSGGAPVSLATVQASLIPEGALMLVYDVGEDAGFVMAIPRAPGRARFFPLRVPRKAALLLGISEENLNEAALRRALAGSGRVEGASSSEAEPLLRLMAQPPAAAEFDLNEPGRPTASLTARLGALAQVLAPPALWKLARGASEIILVPDGILHQLPFEALVLKDATTSARARFWLDDGPPIRYAPSATVLAQISGRDDATRPGTAAAVSLLSVSDPIFDPGEVAATGRAGAASAAAPGPPAQDEAATRGRYERAGGPLTRLPGTAREASEIIDRFRGQLPEARIRSLEGLAANEPAVRAALPGNQYLHIATHGLVDPRGSELFAALALTAPAAPTSDPGDDGFLQLFEIYGLDLRCELAVLSACSGNTGRAVAGEGVFALSRGFVAAGARRVVASQWSVDDRSTAVLMAEFFGRVAASRARQQDVFFAGALRDARLMVRSKPEWSAPYYWAPFVLTGIR